MKDQLERVKLEKDEISAKYQKRLEEYLDAEIKYGKHLEKKAFGPVRRF